MSALTTAPSMRETVAAIAVGTTTAREAVGACLETIRATDGEIGAFRILDEEYVEAQLHALGDARGDRLAGPLHGVAVGVKDVIDTAVLPTGYGSELFESHQPAVDAEIVRRIRRAGGVVVGKTESTEFAMFRPARTRNPADLTRTPGGSSAGSAAAVAAGMVPFALGTQTAGSVIRPAAYCGVYGYKPSRGWTSTDGIWRLAASLDTVGLFARTAADLALAYHVLLDAPPPAYGASSPFPERHAVVMRCAEWGESEVDVHNALDQAAKALQAQGWTVTEAAMPAGWAELPTAHSTVMAVEVAHNMAEDLGDRLPSISAPARAVVDTGASTRAADYLEALDLRDRALMGARALACAGPLVLAPSALGPAPDGTEFTGDPVMCRPWTLMGLPCANVPGFARADGLPVGVQAIGLTHDDQRFLRDLAALESAVTASLP